MQYLFIVYHSEKDLQAMSEAEHQALTDKALDYDEILRKGGHYLGSNALEFVDQATTVRLKKGKVVITDGPYVETREQVGGYLLIEAKDKQEAIALASKVPPIRMGGIEVRAVRKLTHSGEKPSK
jgi:hypothetical protein